MGLAVKQRGMRQSRFPNPNLTVLWTSPSWLICPSLNCRTDSRNRLEAEVACLGVCFKCSATCRANGTDKILEANEVPFAFCEFKQRLGEGEFVGGYISTEEDDRPPVILSARIHVYEGHCRKNNPLP